MSESGASLRLGVIGCGRLAELGYAPAVAALDGVTVAAVADPDRGRRELLASRFGNGRPIPAFETAGELIAAGVAEAVVIASPPAEHVWQAELAGRAGLPALVEKPPASSGSGAARLAALDPPPWVGFNRRFQHAERLVKRIPARGMLSLELELRYRRESWRPVSVADDAGADLAPHLVDLALWLTASRSARVRSATLAGRRAQLELETERGTAVIRCATDRNHRELVTVRDASGHTVARSRDGGPLALVAGRVPGREHPLVRSLRAQLTRFAAAASGGDPGRLATAAEGARVMALIDEARRVAAGETR